MPISIGQPLEELSPPQRGSRIALVIGNKSYRVGALRNPGNDALKVAAVLKRLGFVVSCRIDLTLEQMTDALVDFTGSCRHFETALIYYAGHGMQVDNVNLLVPVDFDLPEKGTNAGLHSAAIKSTINLAEILEATKSAFRTLIFLDACREYPEVTGRRFAQPVPETWRSVTGRGFGMYEADRNELVVAFAAGPGQQALDGHTRNSPYTAAFAELAVTSTSMGKLLEDLRIKVPKATDGRQRPRDSSTLQTPFALMEGSEPPSLDTTGTADDLLFADAAHLDTAEAYRYYLAEFPDGVHVRRAQNALARLTGNERVRIETSLGEAAEKPWYRPGQGRNEWFQDRAETPPMVVIPAPPPRLDGPRSSMEDAESPFAVSRTPITFDQWQAAVSAGASTYVPSDMGWGGGKRCVVNVSWHQANDYVRWLSRLTGQRYRLLTVAEWEHCCRADVRAVAGQHASARPATRGLFSASSSEHRIVGLEPPNGFGLHDMLSHIWEWCADIGTSPNDRQAKGGERGPGAIALTESFYVGTGEPFVGFRVAREIQ